MCHCYSRNCPPGLPNHKNVLAGPSCNNNALGRHYRGQDDTTVPDCDFAGCTFFSSDANRDLPYPADVSLGPVTEQTQSPPVQSAEVSEIMSLLMQQKTDNDDRFRHMQHLTAQVADLAKLIPQLPVSSQPTVSTQTVTTTTVTSPVSSTVFSNPMFSSLPSTVPPYIASAAGQLGATMQQNLAAHNSGLAGYYGLNHAQNVPASHTQQQPVVTNPLEGLGAALGYRNSVAQPQVITSVDQLYAATIKNKQLRAFEFAASSMFPYKSQLTQNNCNAVVFAYGSLKHLEAIVSGLIPGVSETELLARIRHLKNVFEVVSLSSNLASFSEPAWQVAREYDNKIVSDIESGAKTWQGLSIGLETDAIYVAKEVTELKNRPKNKAKEKTDKFDKSDKSDKALKKDPGSGCTTYNTHRSSEGCYWESVNQGKTCVYDHSCSWCKTNRETVERHKSINCTFKTE